MDSLRPAYPSQTASSVMSHPRPSTRERTMTSSSTGSTRQKQRQDSIPAPARPSRPHRDSTTSHRSYRSHRESFSTDPMVEALSGDEEGIEVEEEWERGETARQIKRNRKRDEPMSPVAVVLYVVFFYIIWQILTRSDETEILGHLPLTHLQSLSSSLHSDLRPPSQYHLPYHLPQIPSPIPSTQSDESTSTFRTILGVLIYPIYLIITLIATPFPLLLDTLYLLVQVLVTVLYPVTATFKVLGRTFILAPLGVISSILAVFYPVYVFIGGIIGTGCVLGLGAWWIGKLTLDILFDSKKTKPPKRRVSTTTSGRGRDRTDRSRSNGSATSEQAGSRRERSKAMSPSTEEERERLFTPQVKSMPIMLEDEDESEQEYGHFSKHRGDYRRKHRGTSDDRRQQEREAAVVGLRKRGQRDMWNERR